VDCSKAISLLEGLDAKVLLVDKSYDANAILEYAQEHGITAVIPPKRNQKFKERRIRTYILYNCIIGLKMPFLISSIGEGLLLVMQKCRIISGRYPYSLYCSRYYSLVTTLSKP